MPRAACAADLRVHTGSDDDTERLVATRTATVALDEVAENAGRMIAAFAAEIAARPEVVWLDRPVSEESARPDTLRVAPLQVGDLLADRLFKDRTVVLTSATLTLGGSFEPLARQWGLPQHGASDAVAQPSTAVEPDEGRSGADSADADICPAWSGPGWMSARRSIIAVAASSTWHATCRHLAATACRMPI